MKIFEFINKNKTIILFILLVLLSISYLRNCSKITNLKTEIYKNELNQNALLDTIKFVKNKAGELQAEKMAFTGTYNDLKKLNEEIYKELEKQNSHVISLTTANISLKSKLNNYEDSLRNVLKSIVYDSTKKAYIVKWDFNKKFNDNNYRIIEGQTYVGLDSSYNLINKGSVLLKNEMKFKLTTGFAEEDNKLKIFIKSDYPDISFDNIEGALIDPNQSEVIKKLMKPKKWHFTATLGYGIGMTTFKPDIYLGGGISYIIW